MPLLAKIQNMFLPDARNARLHQLGSGPAEDHFPMRSGVIRMSVADKNLLRSKLRLVRIEPKIESRQMQITCPKLNVKN